MLAGEVGEGSCLGGSILQIKNFKIQKIKNKKNYCLTKMFGSRLSFVAANHATDVLVVQQIRL